MSMSEWAKREVEILKSKNPPEDGVDYVGGCCESALKAYESLMNDGHSGLSISITKDILMKLIDGVALTPIEDTPDVWGEPSRLLDEDKTVYQCKRMSSLFKEVYDDGRVVYSDVRRYYGIPIDNPEYTYTGGGLCILLDEMFPITMPYTPKQGKYKFYTDDFLHDEGNGDYDCKGIYHVITPEGEKVEINEFYYYPKSGETIKLTKEEYERMKAERVNP